MRIITAITSIILVLIILFSSFLGLVSCTSCYKAGYTINGAMNRLDRSFVWVVTKDTADYLLGVTSLGFFTRAEMDHLAEVRLVILKSLMVARILLLLVVFLFILMAARRDRLTLIEETLQITGYAVFVLISVFVLLALNWQWFFTMFHEILFVGAYTFPTDTLMIQLWGDNFFLVMAAFVLGGMIISGIICLLMSAAIKKFQQISSY